MGIVRYALPPVPEDKEIRAQNRARNEEQHRQKKEKKKKKKAKKAKKAEASAKRCREAKKAGLPEPKSSETSVLEVEGGEDLHWLNELLDEEEEDEEVPPANGGTEALGGSETPDGSRIPGGAEGAPYIIVDDGGDEAPQGGSVPLGPQEGEMAPGGVPEVPAGPKGPTEPRPGAEEEAGGSAEAPKARTTIRATATPRSGDGRPPGNLWRPRSARLLEERCAPSKVSGCS